MADVAISALPAQTPVASTAVLPLVEGGTTKKATVLDVVKGGGALLKDGTVAATASLPMGGFKITGGADGTAPTDFTIKSQVESLIAGALTSVADWKNSVRAATTVNITLSGTQTVDGVALANGDRCLVKNQTTGSQNGIYNVGTPWVRATDCDVSAEVTAGLAVAVEEGTANGPAGGRNLFLLTTPNPIVLGSTALTFSGIGSLVADGTTLQLVGNTLSVATGGVGTAQLAADAVTWAKVQNVSAASRVLGRGSAAGAGDVEELTPTGGIEVSGTNLQRSALTGDVTAAAGSNATTIAANAVTTAKILNANVTLAKLAQATGGGVIGRVSNTLGDWQELLATVDGQVFRRLVGDVGWGALDLANANTFINQLPDAKLASVFVKANGTVAFSAAQSMGGFKLTSLGTPTLSTDAATKAYVDGVASGLNVKPSVDVVSITNIAALSGLATTIDGVLQNVDSKRVLLTGQTTASQNGPWEVHSGAWTRPADFAAGSDAAASFFFVQRGTVFADTGWVCTENSGSAVVGTNNILFAQFSAAGVTTVDASLVKTGNQLSRAALTGDVTAAAGSNVTAIAAGVIVNADVNAAAAIAGTKISPNFGAQDIVSTGTIALGNTPATLGHVRLPNGAGVGDGIQFKSGTSGNVLGLGISSGDTLVLGAAAGAGYTISIGGVHSWLVGGALAAQLDADSLDFGPGVNRIRFSASIASDANIDFAALGGDGVTGKALIAKAQGVSGTGSTGGILRLDGGASALGVGGAADMRSGAGATATQAGNYTLRVGATTFLLADGSLTYPTVGMLRSPHDVPVIAGRSAGGTNINGVRWGQTANDVWTFGDAAVASELVGSSVTIGDGSVYLEVATLATNREVVSLLQGTALTTTQMPALTGDRVMFWANATAMPGIGSTSFPAGGIILGVDSTLGLEGKGANGVETTIVPHGDSGNVTKRRMIGVKARAKRTTMALSTGPTIIAEFDVAAVNGSAITTGNFKAQCHYIAKGTADYSQCGDLMAVIEVVAGIPIVGSTPNHRSAFTAGGPFSALVFDVSGTVVRCRATTGGTDGAEVFAFIELMEFEV
jgi:hypothetical protein